MPETPEELYERVKDSLRIPRPARPPQLIGSFAAIWDDILAPVPEDLARERRRHHGSTRGVT